MRRQGQTRIAEVRRSKLSEAALTRLHYRTVSEFQPIYPHKALGGAPRRRDTPTRGGYLAAGSGSETRRFLGGPTPGTLWVQAGPGTQPQGWVSTRLDARRGGSEGERRGIHDVPD